MQGDFSRWTFEAAARYRSVLLQQGRVLLDADWNEQAEITAHHDEARALDTFGRGGVPLTGNAFQITDKAGNTPDKVTWADLRITPGRMYVDGVLVEAQGDARILLGAQPDLPVLAGDTDFQEPTADGRYAFILGVRTHHVTFDEEGRLRESALGGPDTTTRTRTVWQVTWKPTNSFCTYYHYEVGLGEWQLPKQGRMAASLKKPPTSADPCTLNAIAGYTGLENQLYRVQIHESNKSFLWSRENGSVTAALLGIGTTQLPAGVDAELTVDRAGRDEELSIGDGDIVEITSTDRQLRRKQGYLAKVVKPDGLRLTVRWLSGSGVTDLDKLGKAPIVRRWESEPLPISPEQTDLESGIFVEFQTPAGSVLETGDHWLVPARTARLAHGLTATVGGLDPSVGVGNSTGFMAPHGPDRHFTPLAILVRKTEAGVATWTLESDCRKLAPTLTQLTTIGLVGGDGQEALPAKELPEPIRVVVRNGDNAVVGAPVLFTPKGGTVKDVIGPFTPDRPFAKTDADGVASVWWTPDPVGPSTQTLHAQRMNDLKQGIDVEVIVTGRLSKADGVAWEPPPQCETFKNAKTVKAALDSLVAARELRLLGGDGQHLVPPGKVLPQRIRVMVDSGCGPVEGAAVKAVASSGAFLKAAHPGDAKPTTLAGGLVSTTAPTEKDGAAAFWWQPKFAADGSDTLSLSLEGDTTRAPVMAVAQAAPVADGYTPEDGLHVGGLDLYGYQEELPNDAPLTIAKLSPGIIVHLDGAVDERSFTGRDADGDAYAKPVGRVLLDLPWPLRGEWPDAEVLAVGFRSVELAGTWEVDGQNLYWRLQDRERVESWLDNLFGLLADLQIYQINGRIQLDGWAILSSDGRRCLNGHAKARFDGDQTLLGSTDNAVTGGRFDQWFRLKRQ